MGVRGVVACVLLVACRPNPVPSGPPGPEPALSDRDRTRILELETAAEARPDDAVARRRAGLAYMWLTLAGHTSFQEEAERHLEAAFSLDPHDNNVTRSLGRFYNMRTVAGDYSKADMQVAVYGALLGDTAPLDMTHRGFVAWTFFQMGRALTAYNQGKLPAALRRVKSLERTLAARVKQDPQNVELHALAGNFAFFFAGNLPTGKRRRIRTAVEHFDLVRARWDDMRAGARDPVHCPNTRENFMFELAEGHTALRELDRAREIYEELATPRAPANPARSQVARVSHERLQNLEAYAGDLELMPPWPSDVANCVVCHASDAAISEASLHRR